MGPIPGSRVDIPSVPPALSTSEKSFPDGVHAAVALLTALDANEHHDTLSNLADGLAIDCCPGQRQLSAHSTSDLPATEALITRWTTARIVVSC